MNRRTGNIAGAWLTSLRRLVTALLVIATIGSVAAAQDSIEFLSGASSEGKVIQIIKAERKVIFE